MTKPKINREDADGARMIQELQKIGGIDEPEDVALANWRRMGRMDREITKITYRKCFGTKARNN